MSRRDSAVTTREAAPQLAHRRLVCLTHREPFSFKDGVAERTTGGVVTALDAALRDLGGAWIATGERARRGHAPGEDGYDLEQVALSNAEIEGYYEGFSNRVLWPLFHYFVGRVNFDAGEWETYRAVNAKLAKALIARLAADDASIAWVHDYQLALVPALVRARLPRARVGFFLHIPFPAWEVFRILPVRSELLKGLLGSDVIGFHTQSYREAFLETVKRVLGARVDRSGTITWEDRQIRTVALPLGIDVQEIVRSASDPRTEAKAQRLRTAAGAEKLLLGIDRLDYSKGILERFAGFERLLERWPEHRGKVSLLQVAVPSRTRVEEYRGLKRAVDEAVGRINGRYGDASWTPIKYQNRPIGPEDLAAYYRAADVAVVTPLRDGLNLVAKEFVASRIRMGGALVLSEFCGAAEELPQAYLVNPFGPDAIAEAIHLAITDDKSEREARMAALSLRVRSNDVHQWAASFLGLLA